MEQEKETGFKEQSFSDFDHTTEHDRLVVEVRQAFRSMQNQMMQLMQTFEFYQKTAEHRNMLQDQQINEISKAWKEHVATCETQKQDIKDLITALTTVRTGFRLTNHLRNAIVWLAGGITAVYSAYQVLKDYFK